MMARYCTVVLCLLIWLTLAVAFGPAFQRPNSRISFARRAQQVMRRHMSSIDTPSPDEEEEDEEESAKQEQVEESSIVEAEVEEGGVEDVDSINALADEFLGTDEEGPRVIMFAEPPGGVDDVHEEEEDEEEEEIDPYSEKASSEFSTNQGSALDWGGALGTLRERVSDVESGASQSPSNALFRMMTSQTPNEVIGNFVNTANPQVVAAMSGAVGSLLGGLSSPSMGVETVVKASGEKIGSLCFQLQMTGYMFRNAEYVLALKDIMNLKGSKTVQEYKEAFQRIDSDNSGFIESAEIVALLRDVYDDDPPAFEVNAFMDFFDANRDGKISWPEFEKGLGDMSEKDAAKAVAAGTLLPHLDEHDEDEADDYVSNVEPNVSGTIELELKNGKTIEVCAKEYMTNLKKEANALKAALKEEKQLPDAGRSMGTGGSTVMPPNSDEISGGIASYIASREGDLKSLTEGISPEIVDTMKQLVDFVLAGGSSKKGERNRPPDDKAELEMELPGSALQQLALWQLVLGYRLREAEAKGEYKRLLEN